MSTHQSSQPRHAVARVIHRTAATAAAGIAVLALGSGTVQAMEPPGEPAKEHFGCVNGDDDAVGGHPGAAGLTHAVPTVTANTGDESPTAWNAVENAGPITLGSC